MNRRQVSVGLGVAVIAAVLGIGVAYLVASRPPATAKPKDCAPSHKLVPPCGAWWGTYAGTGLADLAGREALAGRKFDLVHVYHDFDDVFPTPAEASLTPARWLFYDWGSRIFGQTGICWGAIAAGDYDRAIDTEAAALRSFGQPVFLSFAAEPEDNVGQTCAPDRTGGVNGTAGQFVAAWRHVHDRLVGAGASNVIWVWNVSGASGPGTLQLYPGDAYVDWIAWDPYNWYRCDGRHARWTSWSDKVAPFYDVLTRAGLTAKPWMLAEYGSDEDRASATRKGDWFRAIAREARAHWPMIKAFVYFDRDHGDCEWNVDSSPDATAGFVQVGHDPYFNQPHS
jgi:Glycosyl hydrolase family 26